MAKRAVSVVEKEGEFYLYEARGGVAVGDPIGGPYGSRVEAEGERFKAMRAPVRKPSGYKPLRHAEPGFARSRVR